ncbi:MAG: (d)CMP kinase [Candidatus Omnitrophica bacterium]|nr:(d)CMP kinase [Candidatus Omnitrophota bacterium]
MIIAIDGPAGCGKSTIARILAKTTGFFYLDTGAIYRALTLKVIEEKLDIADESALIKKIEDTSLEIKNTQEGLVKVIMDGRDVTAKIRLPQVNQLVPDLSRIKKIRDIVLVWQRDMVKDNNVVLEGRDIATVVFPNAEYKFYLDASFSERVRRRDNDLKQSGQEMNLNDVEAELKRRDFIDSTRKYAPLKKAAEAIYIDTTKMTIEEVVNKILKEIR